MSISRSRYKSIVNQTILLLEKRKLIKWEIVKLSLEICSDKGSLGGERGITLKDFCRDTRMSYNTLVSWRKEFKNVVSKIPEHKRVDRDGQIVKATLAQCGAGASKKEVQDTYKELARQRDEFIAAPAPIDNDNSEEADLARFLGEARFKLCNQWVLVNVNQRQLRAMRGHVAQMYNTLEGYFQGEDYVSITG